MRKKPDKRDVATIIWADELLTDLRKLIVDARHKVAQTVNAELTLLYWHMGRRIRRDILKKKRAAYGDEILQTLSAKLTMEFDRGFSRRNLASMVRFAEMFPNAKIVSALRRKLSWSHFIQIIYLDDPLKRDFYTEMCRIEGWSTRTLEKKIQSMLFERTALSRKPEKLMELELKSLREVDTLTPDLLTMERSDHGQLGHFIRSHQHLAGTGRRRLPQRPELHHRSQPGSGSLGGD